MAVFPNAPFSVLPSSWNKTGHWARYGAISMGSGIAMVILQAICRMTERSFSIQLEGCWTTRELVARGLSYPTC